MHKHGKVGFDDTITDEMARDLYYHHLQKEENKLTRYLREVNR